MENTVEEINGLWRMHLIDNNLYFFISIMGFLPMVAAVLFLRFEPVRENFFYHFSNTMVKILVCIYLFVLVSLSITQAYLNSQISKGVIEINRKLPEHELWLMRVIEKDAVKKLEKLERR